MGSTSQPDFCAVEQALRGLGSLGEPAEVHGEYCGLACVMGVDSGPAWAATILADADRQADSNAENLRDVLQLLAVTTWNALDSGDMEIVLLLPSDDETLEVRAESLGLWCQGFMHGLGAGSEQGKENPLLSDGVTHEIIADFSEITRAAYTADETEAEAETAFMELVEFVRVSVQLAFEELHSVRRTPTRKQHH